MSVSKKSKTNEEFMVHISVSLETFNYFPASKSEEHARGSYLSIKFTLEDIKDTHHSPIYVCVQIHKMIQTRTHITPYCPICPPISRIRHRSMCVCVFIRYYVCIARILCIWTLIHRHLLINRTMFEWKMRNFLIKKKTIEPKILQMPFWHGVAVVMSLFNMY